MESMGRSPGAARSFTPGFKAEIVDLCQRGDRSVGQVAGDFDLAETAVWEWDGGACQDGGLTTQQRRELAELRREIAGFLRQRGPLAASGRGGRRRQGPAQGSQRAL